MIVTNLKQKLNLTDRMKAEQKCMRQKQEETRDQIEKLHPLLKLVVQRTKELQAEVCFTNDFVSVASIFHRVFYTVSSLIADRTGHIQEIQKQKSTSDWRREYLIMIYE